MKSLLRLALEEDEPRLYPLEMARAYRLERLKARGEMERARDALAAYCLALAQEARPALLGEQRAAWQRRLEHEQENLQEALRWLLQHSRAEEALRLVLALEQFWSYGDYANEGRGFLQQALEVWRQSDVPVPAQINARALRGIDSHKSQHNDGGPQTDRAGGSARAQRKDGRGTADVSTRDTGDLPPVRPHFPPALEELTPREREILSLLAEGLSNSQIAERLVLSPHTVNVHNQSNFGKLGVHSHSGATRYALEHHLVWAGFASSAFLLIALVLEDERDEEVASCRDERRGPYYRCNRDEDLY